MTVPFWLWLAVIAAVLVMRLVDAHRHAHVIGLREAAWSAAWLVGGVGFGALIWWRYGGELAQQYFAGYLIEKSLALDNVFVWAIIFSYFAVLREYQHRVQFVGVLGALVFRGAFITAGSVLTAVRSRRRPCCARPHLLVPSCLVVTPVVLPCRAGEESEIPPRLEASMAPTGLQMPLPAIPG